MKAGVIQKPAPPSIHDLTRDRLQQAGHALGMPAWRVGQLWHWLYRQRAATWDDMHNLPGALRARLAEKFSLCPAQIMQRRADGGPDGAVKTTLALHDGEIIETVLIPAGRRRTVCVSTQAGCKFKCAFCASGMDGFNRNLTTGEIVAQVLTAGADTPPTHVVFMGIGEPMDNYDNVLAAVRILNDAEGLAIGARRMTISTCGIVPGIQRLAGEGMQAELSVSLHAPDDELRSRLMPVNRRYPLNELLPACRDYAARTRRIITFEYTLIDGVNAAPQQARQLVRRLRSLPCRVNLIPLSPVGEFPGAPPPAAALNTFSRILEQAGINTTVRRSRGRKLQAACGQLRLGCSAPDTAPNP